MVVVVVVAVVVVVVVAGDFATASLDRISESSWSNFFSLQAALRLVFDCKPKELRFASVHTDSYSLAIVLRVSCIRFPSSPLAIAMRRGKTVGCPCSVSAG